MKGMNEEHLQRNVKTKEHRIERAAKDSVPPHSPVSGVFNCWFDLKLKSF